MKHQLFGQIVSIMLIVCSMINHIQGMTYWWLYLVFGFIIGMSVIGMQKNKDA
jgi:membrane protein required for beta-lactamase induction